MDIIDIIGYNYYMMKIKLKKKVVYGKFKY